MIHDWSRKVNEKEHQTNYRKNSIPNTYGAMLTAIPCWATGTACGIIAGNIMPARVVSALSVSLFGMFLAIIIPPADSITVRIMVLVPSEMEEISGRQEEA